MKSIILNVIVRYFMQHKSLIWEVTLISNSIQNVATKDNNHIHRMRW
jgi:hypothetical protein